MGKSGILMHITSLPGPHGIGSLGAPAYHFVEFLHAAGQSYWQILPLCPTGYGDSPYQALSAFAGNPYLIDLDVLVEKGLLTRQEADRDDGLWDPGRVDYGTLYVRRTDLLRKAYARFRPTDGYREFVRDNGHWLEDYSLFMALKEQFHGARWQTWSLVVMLRLEAVLDHYRQLLRDTIEFHCFLQYEFRLQWDALRSFAHSRGVRIIGDVPSYVPLDSADVWANPQLFQLDANRRPRKVAGCPPDAFATQGQVWGSPLYDWEKHRSTGFQWWIRRLKAARGLYDVVRLDHFRGFESYWELPSLACDASQGRWVRGPGMDFIRTIREALPNLPIIAGDLGSVTPQVRQFRQDSGFPGMKVMEFTFDARSPELPGAYPADSVVYSATHDNRTLAQWFREAPREDVDLARSYLGLNEEEGEVWGMIRGCMECPSRLCIVQMQDYLELDGAARMNRPGTLSPANWSWRAAPGFDGQELAEKIRALTEAHHRLPECSPKDGPTRPWGQEVTS